MTSRRKPYVRMRDMRSRNKDGDDSSQFRNFFDVRRVYAFCNCSVVITYSVAIQL